MVYTLATDSRGHVLQAENLNPGGSVKDRAARALVQQALAAGVHTIVEGTGKVPASVAWLRSRFSRRLDLVFLLSL